MDPGVWTAIYTPLFVLLFVIIPHRQRIRRLMIQKIKKRREGIKMTNEVIKNHIGSNCKITTASGSAVIGEIINVNENWLEIKTKKGIELVNAEFIQSIKIN